MDASLLNPMAMNGGRGVNTERNRNELLNDFGERTNDTAVVPRVRGADVQQPHGSRSDVRWVGGGGRAQEVRPNTPSGRRSQSIQISGSLRAPGARPSTGAAVGDQARGGRLYTGQTTNPRLPGYQPPSRQNIQQPDYSYEMSAEELEEQCALLNSYSRRQQQRSGAPPIVRVQTVHGTYRPHHTQQVGYTPRNGGWRAPPRPALYEDDEEDCYPADGDRMGTTHGGRTGPPMGGMFYDDDGFGTAMGGFGGDGFGDPDELWNEMTGRMDQMFGGITLCGGGGGGYGFR
jgi:hypothetical protein